MRRGFVRSFTGGLLLGTALGALAVWIFGSSQRSMPPEVRERAEEALRRARQYREQALATVRSQLETARQAVESRLKAESMGDRQERSAVAEETPASAES